MIPSQHLFEGLSSSVLCILRFTLFCTAFCIACDAAAQTGPGGIGASASNELWLPVQDNAYTDAGVTQGGNNTAIQQWNDISGNSRHAIQATIGLRPTLINNQANGLPVLRFDGTNTRILSAGINTASVATIFVVVRFNNLVNNNDGVIQAGPAGTGFSGTTTDKSIGMWINTSTGAIWGRGVQNNNAIRDISQTNVLSTGQFYIITQQYDGANITQFVNGVTAGSNTYNGTLKSWTDFGIGRQAAESLNGDIAEIIVHRASLNTAQRIITENYLAAKYGISLNANDLYNEDNAGNGNYDHEVAGIGRSDAFNIHDNARGSAMVQIFNPSALGNGEFMLWGHDNGTAMATNNTDVPGGVQARLSRVWRVSEVNTAGTGINVGSVSMRWDLSNLGPVTVTDLALLIDTDNDGNFSDETPVTGATSIGSNIYEFSGITGLGNNRRFTLGTTNQGQTALPVVLLDFYGEKTVSNQTQLGWSTASEHNASHFIVERRTEQTTWTECGSVAAAGTSLVKQHYRFTDKGLSDDGLYYRLKLVDKDGSSSFSKIIFVGIVQSERVLIYPNPVCDFIYINECCSDEIKIYNSDGTDVSTFADFEKDVNRMRCSVQKLPPGIYLLRSTYRSARFVKIK